MALRDTSYKASEHYLQLYIEHKSPISASLTLPLLSSDAEESVLMTPWKSLMQKDAKLTLQK